MSTTTSPKKKISKLVKCEEVDIVVGKFRCSDESDPNGFELIEFPLEEVMKNWISEPLLGLEGMKQKRRIYLSENKLSVMTTSATKLMNIIKSASWTSLQGLSAYLTSQLNDFASYYTSQCLKEFCELVNINFSPSMTLTVTDFISKLITKLNEITTIEEEDAVVRRPSERNVNF